MSKTDFTTTQDCAQFAVDHGASYFQQVPMNCTNDPKNNYTYTCSDPKDSYATYNDATLNDAQKSVAHSRWGTDPKEYACNQGCTKGSCSRGSIGPLDGVSCNPKGTCYTYDEIKGYSQRAGEKTWILGWGDNAGKPRPTSDYLAGPDVCTME